MISFFAELGRQIERRWRAKDYDDAAFAEIAYEALLETPPADHVDPTQVIRSLCDDEGFVTQVNPAATFGQPPITVFCTDRFYIEVLYWVDGTTSIHQHGFSGAFHVLAGSSIHARYEFDIEHMFNLRILEGRLRRKDVELLSKGATRPILAGNKLIHSLFHLDRPSVSVVVRTLWDPGNNPPYLYLGRRLAVDPFHRPPPVARRLQALQFLHDVQHPELESIAREFLSLGGTFEGYLVLEKLFQCMSAERFATFLEGARQWHPRFVDVAGPTFTWARREQRIVARRRRVRDPNHRYFLALLLNAPPLRDILQLVASRYPQHSPVDQIVTWVKEMTTTRLDGDHETLIGMDLDDACLSIFRAMLEGRTVDGIAEQLREEFDASDVAAQLPLICEVSDAFRKSPLFGPMFTEP
jgi:hypothetical protein